MRFYEVKSFKCLDFKKRVVHDDLQRGGPTGLKSVNAADPLPRVLLEAGRASPDGDKWNRWRGKSDPPRFRPSQASRFTKKVQDEVDLQFTLDRMKSIWSSTSKNHYKKDLSTAKMQQCMYPTQFPFHP